MPAIEIPLIETERLRLRGYRHDDFTACAAIWAEPDVVRHTAGKPLAPEEAWAKLLRNAGLWLLFGYGYWAVEEKATGEFVGEIGFGDFERDIQPSIQGIPEAGWLLASRVHGRGYATEAVRAALRWRDEHCAGMRTVSIIHTGNDASFRVAEKCGFREFERTRYKENEVVVLERFGDLTQGKQA